MWGYPLRPETPLIVRSNEVTNRFSLLFLVLNPTEAP